MSEWRRAVWNWIIELPSRMELSANDIRDRFGEPDPLAEPNAGNNAIGKVFPDARKAGLIEKAGRRIQSNKPTRKGGSIDVWYRTDKREARLF